GVADERPHSAEQDRAEERSRDDGSERTRAVEAAIGEAGQGREHEAEERAHQLEVRQAEKAALPPHHRQEADAQRPPASGRADDLETPEGGGAGIACARLHTLIMTRLSAARSLFASRLRLGDVDRSALSTTIR